MTLQKRYLRNIKESLSFYIAAIVLTGVALLLFYLFYISGTGIMDYGDAFFERNHLEDATFTTYVEIPDDEIAGLEEAYDVTLEKEHYVNITEDDFTVRVFRANEKIDLYEIIDGADVSADDEIVISKGYAINEGVDIGDTITIREKEYTVTGYFLRPDYLYMLENFDDTYKNVTTFFLAYLTDDAYDALDAASCQYKVVYGEDADSTQFRKDINEEYMVNSYLAKENNMRITMVDDQATMFLVMGFVFLFTLPLITVALISIIIGRRVKNEQKMIGTLSALGYSDGKLMWHYSLQAMIPGLLGGLLLAVVIKLLQQPYGEMCLADYEPMPATFTLPVPIAVLGVIVPTLLYMWKAARKVKKLLKKDTAALLNGSADDGGRIRRVMTKKEGPVARKFAVRSILANPGRSIVVALGAFLGGMIILVAFMFIDSINAVVDKGSTSMGSFGYEYVLNALETEPVDDADALVIGRMEYDGTSFTVFGADEDVQYLNIETTDGKRAALDDGYYVTNVMAYAYGLSGGDTFTFVNPTTMEEKTVTVAGIISNDSQKLLICSMDAARELLGFDGDVYNGLLSAKSLSLGDKVSKKVTANDIRQQMETILDEMGAIIYALAVIGAIICAASLYVTVNMLISENRRNISMLKVLGLKNREINRMVLDVNHVLIPIGLVLGMLAGYGCMVIVFRIYSGMEGVLYSAVVSAKSIVLTVVVVLACYAFSLFVVRRKADQVDMVESLKDTRE